MLVNTKHNLSIKQSSPIMHGHSYRDVSIDQGKLDRLLKEKQALLNTGMYTEDHRIIRALNEEIDRVKRGN
jgi:hypothetical protein